LDPIAPIASTGPSVASAAAKFERNPVVKGEAADAASVNSGGRRNSAIPITYRG
jgi:hypothetical protein